MVRAAEPFRVDVSIRWRSAAYVQRERGVVRRTTPISSWPSNSNGEAAAYPIRQLAYHHLVQDIVGGVPIVVTY